MSFPSKVTPPLKELCHLLIDKGSYGYLESFANFLGAITTNRWNQLGLDEQVYWLERLHSLLNIKGWDGWPDNEPNYETVSRLVLGELERLKD